MMTEPHTLAQRPPAAPAVSAPQTARASDLIVEPSTETQTGMALVPSDARDLKLECATILAQWHEDDREQFHEDLREALDQAVRRALLCETDEDGGVYAYAENAALKGRELRAYWAAKAAAADSFDAVINAEVNNRALDEEGMAYARRCRDWAITVCAIFDASPPYKEGLCIDANDYPPIMDEAFPKRFSQRGGAR